MPIPSVTSSSTTTEDHIKCKAVSSEIIAYRVGNDMETDVLTEYNKLQVGLCQPKKKALLLHARRDDDDRTVNLTEERLCPVAISGLYAGSRYHGTQKCGAASYEVNVELLVSTLLSIRSVLSLIIIFI